MELPILTHPERLWLLLLLPVLYLLSLPPRPRRELATPHMEQWLRAQARLRRRPLRFRTLRFLLLVLAFCASVLAFAGPEGRGGRGPTSLVVLLDRSASMAAAVDGESTWELAVERVRRRLASLPSHVEVRVALVGEQLAIREGVGARELIDPGRPAGRPAVPRAELAASRQAPDTAVWTISDGHGPGPAPAAGALELLGEPRDNVALAVVEVEDRWPLPELTLRLEVVSSARERARRRVLVTGAVEPVAEHEVVVDAGETTPVALDLRRRGPAGLLTVRLSDGDALAADDVLTFELPALPAPEIAVLADAESGPAIHVAAVSLATEVQGTVTETREGGSSGFLLVEGGVLDPAPGQRRALYFGTRSPAGRTPELVLDPTVVDWNRSHPITAGLDLSDLQVDQALRQALPEGEPLILASAGGRPPEPLAVIVEGGGMASVHLAFRLQDSNFALLPAFPQFLRRAFVVCHGADVRQVALTEPGWPPAESDLRRVWSAEARPLPAFGAPGGSWAVPLLLLALLALALRVYIR